MKIKKEKTKYVAIVKNETTKYIEVYKSSNIYNGYKLIRGGDWAKVKELVK